MWPILLNSISLKCFNKISLAVPWRPESKLCWNSKSYFIFMLPAGHRCSLLQGIFVPSFSKFYKKNSVQQGIAWVIGIRYTNLLPEFLISKMYWTLIVVPCLLTSWSWNVTSMYLQFISLTKVTSFMCSFMF